MESLFSKVEGLSICHGHVSDNAKASYFSSKLLQILLGECGKFTPF